MEFTISEQAEGARDVAREFADKILRPAVSAYRCGTSLPSDIVSALGESGLLGGMIPVEWGGSGMTHEAFVAMIEELSLVDHVVGGQASQPSGLLGASILRFGTDEQREKYLRALCSGATHGSVAMTEPSSGTDVAGTSMKAVRTADGYILNGQKVFVSHVANAEFFLTFARTGDAPRSLSAFLVDAGNAGVHVSPIVDVGVLRPHSWGQVFFDEAVVPASSMLGADGQGLRVAMCALEAGRLAISARAVGAARSCVNRAVVYSRDRVVMGKEIGRYQHIQRRLVDMLLGIESARLLTYRAAATKDAGAEIARVDAAAAKLMATHTFEMVASNTIEIFGGYGLTDEEPFGHYLLDAKALQIAEGTAEVQYMLVGETMLGYRNRRNDAITAWLPQVETGS